MLNDQCPQDRAGSRSALFKREAPASRSDRRSDPSRPGARPPGPGPGPWPRTLPICVTPAAAGAGGGTLGDGAADVVLLLQVVGAVALGGDGAAHETWRGGRGGLVTDPSGRVTVPSGLGPPSRARPPPGSPEGGGGLAPSRGAGSGPREAPQGPHLSGGGSSPPAGSLQGAPRDKGPAWTHLRCRPRRWRGPPGPPSCRRCASGRRSRGRAPSCSGRPPWPRTGHLERATRVREGHAGEGRPCARPGTRRSPSPITWLRAGPEEPPDGVHDPIQPGGQDRAPPPAPHPSRGLTQMGPRTPTCQAIL